MLKTVTTINGKFVSRGKDKISVFDNSLLYAEGLFETLLAVDDRLIFLDQHLQRLYRGARLIGLQIPITPNRLTEWMHKTVRKHPDRIKKLRLTVTSGEAARWVGVQGKSQIILSASPHEIPIEPYKLHVSPYRVDQDSVFRRIKTISYAIHAAALKQARERGCDDALLLNERNYVAEVTSANVYWVKRRKIYTPPLSAGCLEGITRRIVLREAGEIGLDVIERNCSLATLVKADEVFISSSLKLVIGVSLIKEHRRVYKLQPGPVTKQLMEHFYGLVEL